jgi:hypothetical protein
MARKTRIAAAIGAVGAAAAIAGAAVIPSAGATELGKVVAQVPYFAPTVDYGTAWALTWGKAYDECQRRFPGTLSLELQLHVLAGSNEGQQLQTLWGCRNTL